MLNRHLAAASLLAASLLAPHAAHATEFFLGLNLANMNHEGGGFTDHECPPTLVGYGYGVEVWNYCLMDYDNETSRLLYLRLGARFNEHVQGELRMGRGGDNSGTHISCLESTPDLNIRDLIKEHSPIQSNFGSHCFESHMDLGSIIFGGVSVQFSLPVRPWVRPYMTLGYTAYRLDIDRHMFSAFGNDTMANRGKPLGKVGYDFTYGMGFDARIMGMKNTIFNVEYNINESFGTLSFGIARTYRNEP